MYGATHKLGRMHMEDTSVWTLLFSKESMAGVWAVIGALIALIGVLGSNLCENYRNKKERQHELIRNAYVGAVDHVACSLGVMLKACTGEVNDSTDDVLVSEKFYRLFLIASPDVIDAFSKFSNTCTEVVIQLQQSFLDIQQCASEKDLSQQYIDRALKNMEQSTQYKNEYADKGAEMPEDLLQLLDKQFEKAQNSFDDNVTNLEKLNQREGRLKLSLLQQGIELVIDAYPEAFNAIFLMRKDLDRKLSKKESRQIQASIELMKSNLKKDLLAYIKNVEMKLSEMEKDE
jgi:hypothetical protein